MDMIYYKLNKIYTELFKMCIFIDCIVMFDNDIDNHN